MPSRVANEHEQRPTETTIAASESRDLLRISFPHFGGFVPGLIVPVYRIFLVYLTNRVFLTNHRRDVLPGAGKYTREASV